LIFYVWYGREYGTNYRYRSATGRPEQNATIAIKEIKIKKKLAYASRNHHYRKNIKNSFLPASLPDDNLVNRSEKNKN